MGGWSVDPIVHRHSWASLYPRGLWRQIGTETPIQHSSSTLQPPGALISVTAPAGSSPGHCLLIAGADSDLRHLHQRSASEPNQTFHFPNTSLVQQKLPSFQSETLQRRAVTQQAIIKVRTITWGRNGGVTSSREGRELFSQLLPNSALKPLLGHSSFHVVNVFRARRFVSSGQILLHFDVHMQENAFMGKNHQSLKL